MLCFAMLCRATDEARPTSSDGCIGNYIKKKITSKVFQGKQELVLLTTHRLHSYTVDKLRFVLCMQSKRGLSEVAAVVVVVVI